MELTPATAEIYVRLAFSRMREVADRLGDDLVNVRPVDEATNAAAALIIHCCEVAEFWLGHVALGRPSHRVRDEEFTKTATVAELRQHIDRAVETTVEDIRRLEAGQGRDDGGRQFLEGGDGSDAAVVLHVLEELFQHLGHMEITTDVLNAR